MPDLPPHAGELCWSGTVGPADIDENGHMNVRAFDRVLEDADMAFFLAMGWTEAYPRLARRGYFRVEKHLRYQQELLEGTPICVTAYLAFCDLRRFQMFFQLWNTQTAERSATMESMLLHVDLTTRRNTPLQDDAQAALWLAMQARQAEMPVPPGLGRRVTRERQG